MFGSELTGKRNLGFSGVNVEQAEIVYGRSAWRGLVSGCAGRALLRYNFSSSLSLVLMQFESLVEI